MGRRLISGVVIAMAFVWGVVYGWRIALVEGAAILCG